MYTFTITLYILGGFLPYKPEDLVFKLPLFIDLANYGIPQLEKDINEDTEEYLESLEQYGYTTTSPINIEAKLTLLNPHHINMFNFKMNKSWSIMSVKMNISLINEEDFSIGGKLEKDLIPLKMQIGNYRRIYQGSCQ